MLLQISAICLQTPSAGHQVPILRIRTDDVYSTNHPQQLLVVFQSPVYKKSFVTQLPGITNAKIYYQFR